MIIDGLFVCDLVTLVDLRDSLDVAAEALLLGALLPPLGVLFSSSSSSRPSSVERCCVKLLEGDQTKERIDILVVKQYTKCNWQSTYIY